ncbi:hypothetical protein HaLaN_26862, partial [Haematococcus lacustris]
MADAAKTVSLSAVSAAAEGAQLRRASHGCGCTHGSVAWVPSSSCVPPACTVEAAEEQLLHYDLDMSYCRANRQGDDSQHIGDLSGRLDRPATHPRCPLVTAPHPAAAAPQPAGH